MKMEKFKHYKNKKIYEVLYEAKHTESEEILVIYSDSDGKIWARPKKMFYEHVVGKGGELIPRFKKL